MKKEGYPSFAPHILSDIIPFFTYPTLCLNLLKFFCLSLDLRNKEVSRRKTEENSSNSLLGQQEEATVSGKKKAGCLNHTEILLWTLGYVPITDNHTRVDVSHKTYIKTRMQMFQSNCAIIQFQLSVNSGLFSEAKTYNNL